jgi:hypothetical protein
MLSPFSTLDIQRPPGTLWDSFRWTKCFQKTVDIIFQIKNMIDGHTEPCGSGVTAVEIKGITLPDTICNAPWRKSPKPSVSVKPK